MYEELLSCEPPGRVGNSGVETHPKSISVVEQIKQLVILPSFDVQQLLCRDERRVSTVCRPTNYITGTGESRVMVVTMMGGK